MKRVNDRKADLLPEYDFSKGIRGKHRKQFENGVAITIFSPNSKSVDKARAKGITLVAIEPDVSAVFADANSVNAALRHIIAAMPRPKSRKRPVPVKAA
jgi:hypothetical protein